MEPIEEHAEAIALRPTQLAQTEYGELRAALAKLRPKQREALVLVGASGLSYEEAAERCGCPTGTIKSRVNRARADLAQLLAIESRDDFADDPVISAAMAGPGRAAAGT